MSALRQRIEALSESKRRLLAHWVYSLTPESASGTGPGLNPQASPHHHKRLVAYVAIAPSADGNRGASSSSMVSELRSYLKEKLPGYMVPDLVVPLDKMPRMPNGKVSVRDLPDLNLAESHSEQTYAAPRNETEMTLAKIWSELLGVEPVGVHDDFFEIGGDSIVSIQVISRAREAGIRVEPKNLVDHPTVAELASVVQTNRGTDVDQDPISGEIPLTPIQHWFLGLNLKAPHHWNQSALYELPADLDEITLKESVAHCIRRHDALRIRYECDASGWQQFVVDVEAVDVPFEIVDLSSHAKSEQHLAFERHLDRAQRSFDLSRAPLVCVVLFELGDRRPKKLLVTAHHLVVDVVSWRILMADLEQFYKSLSTAASLVVSDSATSYGRWAESLVEYAKSPDLEGELHYWLTPPSTEFINLPVDFAHEGNGTEASAQTVSVSLDSECTQSFLSRAHAAYKTQPNDLLLTAVVQTICRWTGAGSLHLGLEGHGRESVTTGTDVSHTVGWFTSFFPATLSLETPDDPGTAIKSIKEQLRAIPQRGLGYGVLRYLSGNRQIEERSIKTPAAQVLFNYLGPMGGSSDEMLFRPIPGPAGTVRNPENQRSHLVEINAAVIGGKLQVDWIYSHFVHRRETIERLAGRFIESLASLVEHCASPDAGGFTPSDFPESGLSQDELDRFLDDLD